MTCFSFSVPDNNSSRFSNSVSEGICLLCDLTMIQKTILQDMVCKQSHIILLAILKLTTRFCVLIYR